MWYGRGLRRKRDCHATISILHRLIYAKRRPHGKLSTENFKLKWDNTLVVWPLANAIYGMHGGSEFQFVPPPPPLIRPPHSQIWDLEPRWHIGFCHPPLSASPPPMIAFKIDQTNNNRGCLWGESSSSGVYQITSIASLLPIPKHRSSIGRRRISSPLTRFSSASSGRVSYT